MNFRRISYSILVAIISLLIIGTFLSLLIDVNIRYIKILDFPRLQFSILLVLFLSLFLIVAPIKKLHNIVITVLAVGSLAIQLHFLVYYTPIVSTTVDWATESIDSKNSVSILFSNVKMSNRTSEKLIQQIKTLNPDIVILTETDAWWDSQIQFGQDVYPYSKRVINDKAYGKIVLSKLPFENVVVEYLQNDHVPSIHGQITMPDQQQFTLYAVHPVPPFHYKDLPDNEGQREEELLIIGKKVKNEKLPTIVVGDLNDVVWGYSDRLFGVEDVLDDVRVGRGLYNTFDVQNILMRWPIDHVFVTDEFSVKTIERLDEMGSDHFPLYIELVLN